MLRCALGGPGTPLDPRLVTVLGRLHDNTQPNYMTFDLLRCFYRATRYVRAVQAVGRCPSVHPYVCPSVCHTHV